MTYAYDNYIQLPTVDLYDTLMMAMAINAAKDMYDRGLQLIKDFYKEYGDFMSPFAKDMEAYGNMVGGVRNMVNEAYARGIDLARSPEGRALINKAVYSIDPGEFNRMRHNAKVGYEYLSEVEKARAKGEFDLDYEDFLLRLAGLGPFDQFSSKMGMWNRPGPGVYQDVNKWTHHLFDNMELSYDPELSKKYPGFMAYTKSLDTMNQIVDNNIAGLLNTDLGKYRLSQLKASGLSDEQAVAALKKMVVDSNYELNLLKLVEDPIYMQALRYRQAVDVASMRAAARRNGTAGQSYELNAPTTFIDRLNNNINANFEQKQIGRESIGNSFATIIDYWDKMAKSVENHGKVVGQKDVEKQVAKGIITPSPYGVSPSVGVAKTVQTTEKGKENVYDQSQNPSYNIYKYEKSRWANFSNGNYYPSKYDTRKTEDGKYIVHVIRDIIKKGDAATPEERQLLQNYQLEDFQKMIMKAKSSSPGWSTVGGKRGLMSVRDAKKRASDFWDGFAAEGLGPIQNLVLHQLFIGADNTVKDPDLSNKYYSVRFGSGYHYAPVRQLGISGNAVFKHNDIHSKFDRFLQDKTGISVNTNDVRVAGIPSATRVGKQLDILSHPLMSRSQIQQFYNSLSYSDKEKYKDIDGLCKELGLLPVDQKITYRDKNNEIHSSDTYYEVPVIRTIENLGGLNFRDINALSDIIEFNASTADKNIINSENQSMIDDLPLELATQLLQGQ